MMGAIRSGLCALLMLVATGCADTSSQLVGEWVQIEGARPDTRLTLREDGTGKLEVQGGVNYQLESWVVESERHVKFQIYNQSVLARFVLNDDSLELSRVDSFDMNGTYRRADD